MNLQQRSLPNLPTEKMKYLRARIQLPTNIYSPVINDAV